MSDKEKNLSSEFAAAVAAAIEQPLEAQQPPVVEFDPMKNDPLWESDPDFIDPFVELPPIRTWATIGGRPALPKDGIVTFQAKYKQGKSFAIYALSLALLSEGKFDTLEPLEHPRLIMIFDLEMPKPTLTERVRNMADALGANNKRFVVCSLRDAANRAAKVQMIEDKVNRYNPDIVVIDQIAELVDDINSTTESAAAMDWVKRMSCGRSLWAVIHENKSATDGNMTGHLGTSLTKGNDEGYVVAKGNGVFTITCKLGRSTATDDYPPVKFAVNDLGAVVTADNIILAQRIKYQTEQIELMQGYFGTDSSLRYNELKKRIREMDGVGIRTAEDRITAATEVGALIKQRDGNKSIYRVFTPQENEPEL